MTKDEFEKLADEWLGIEYEINAGGLTPERHKQAVARQIEIERLQDQSGFEFDEDGKVVQPESVPAGR